MKDTLAESFNKLTSALKECRYSFEELTKVFTGIDKTKNTTHKRNYKFHK